MNRINKMIKTIDILNKQKGNNQSKNQYVLKLFFQDIFVVVKDSNRKENRESGVEIKE